jgi:integrase
MAHSTAAVRPEKPRPDFPLFPHRNGRWAKKVRGRFVYFTHWRIDQKGEAAAAQWAEQKEDLLAGRAPRGDQTGLTVVELVNRFLTAKDALVTTGELRQRTWDDYHTVCERVVRVFGRNRLVSDLAGDDFARLRADWAKTRGPYALLGDITRTRVLFKWGFDEGLIETPIRYGQSFSPPNKKTLRLARAAKGKRKFEAEQIRMMLDGATIKRKKVAGASQPLRTMILLAINGGLGNGDVGTLPLSAINLKTGWVDYPRPKTGIDRRFPVWPETAKALKEWLAVRPEPTSDEAQSLVFVTNTGRSWSKTEADNPVSKETAKLLKRLGLHRPGLNFYALRHTFQTVGEGARDSGAVQAIMGHAPHSSDMSAVYREGIDDARLKAVTNHIRRWLFSKGSKK